MSRYTMLHTYSVEELQQPTLSSDKAVEGLGSALPGRRPLDVLSRFLHLPRYLEVKQNAGT